MTTETKHTPECEARQQAAADWVSAWRAYCKACDANGWIGGSGGSYLQPPDPAEPCGVCLGDGFCPRCGAAVMFAWACSLEALDGDDPWGWEDPGRSKMVDVHPTPPVAIAGMQRALDEAREHLDPETIRKLEWAIRIAGEKRGVPTYRRSVLTVDEWLDECSVCRWTAADGKPEVWDCGCAFGEVWDA
jgi:hypothetical protein